MSTRDKKLVELEMLLQRPRNKRKIVFGRNLAEIKFDNKRSDPLIISGSAHGVVVSGSEIVFDGELSMAGGRATPWAASSHGHSTLDINDNQKLLFGTEENNFIQYNTTGDGHLIISSSATGGIALSASNINITAGPPSSIILSGSYIGLGGAEETHEDAGSTDIMITGSTVTVNASTSLNVRGLSLHIGSLGNTKNYPLAPSISLPVTTFDNITDLRNPANGATAAQTAIGLISDGVGGGEMIKLGTFNEAGGNVIVKGSVVSLTNHAGTLYWYPADANTSTGAADARAMLGAALDAEGGADEGLVLLRGYIRIDASLMNNPNSIAADIGQPVYLSTTGGEYDMDPPTGNNDIARIVGHVLDVNSDDDYLIYFNPSNDWVKVT